MYIDFGGNQMLKKGKSFGPGGSPLQFGQCPKERALACPPSLRLQRWKFWNGKYLKSPQPELLRLSFWRRCTTLIRIKYHSVQTLFWIRGTGAVNGSKTLLVLAYFLKWSNDRILYTSTGLILCSKDCARWYVELWTGQIEGERLVNHTKTAKPVTWHSVCEQALFRSTNQLAAPSPGASNFPNSG